ncbi:hypothetical protein BS17DRAFT_789889, partial [Gyrodon lividus]
MRYERSQRASSLSEVRYLLFSISLSSLATSLALHSARVLHHSFFLSSGHALGYTSFHQHIHISVTTQLPLKFFNIDFSQWQTLPTKDARISPWISTDQ